MYGWIGIIGRQTVLHVRQIHSGPIFPAQIIAVVHYDPQDPRFEFFRLPQGIPLCKRSADGILHRILCVLVGCHDGPGSSKHGRLILQHQTGEVIFIQGFFHI